MKDPVDPVVRLLTKRAELMAWLDTCGEEDECIAFEAMRGIDQTMFLQRAMSPLGRALVVAFLAHELRELIEHTPDDQRRLIQAYLKILSYDLPDVPAEVKAVLGK